MLYSNCPPDPNNHIPCTQWEGPCSGIGGPYYQIFCYCDNVLRAKECGWTADPIGRHRWCSSLCMPGQTMRTDVCCNSPCGTCHGRVNNFKSFYNATQATAVILNYTVFAKNVGNPKAILIDQAMTIDGFKVKLQSNGIPYVVIPPGQRASYDADSADIILATIFYQPQDIGQHDKQTVITGIMVSDKMGLQMFNNRDFIITIGTVGNQDPRQGDYQVVRVRPTGPINSSTQHVFKNVADYIFGAVLVLAIESEDKAGCKNNCHNIPMPNENDFLMNVGKGITAFKTYVANTFGKEYASRGIQYAVLNPYDELDHTHDTATLTYSSIERLRFVVYPYSQTPGDFRPLVRDVTKKAVPNLANYSEFSISMGKEIIRINGVDLTTIGAG